MAHRLETYDRTHYCRMCNTEFLLGHGEKMSPHSRVWHHIRNQHDPEKTFEACTRHCAERAQEEELDQGRRLYGLGAPRPSESLKPAATYEKIFMTFEGDDA